MEETGRTPTSNLCSLMQRRWYFINPYHSHIPHLAILSSKSYCILGHSQSYAKEFAACTSVKFLRLVTCSREEVPERQESSVSQYPQQWEEDLSLRMCCGLGEMSTISKSFSNIIGHDCGLYIAYIILLV